jgi:hypothetical protein
MTSLTATLGRVTLKNPLIVKSVNESDAARDQLQCAEYLLLDEYWNPAEQIGGRKGR